MSQSRNKRRSASRRAARRLSPKQLVLVLIVLAVYLVVDRLPNFTDGGPAATALSAQTSVHFLDVGQGDATLFLSGEQAVLIDASTSDAGDTIVDYLDELGVDRLDAVIATHPHADHIGGMRQVLQSVPAGTIYLSNGVANTKTYEKLLDEIETQDIPVVVPEIGDVLTLDSGATFTFLSPDPDEDFDDLNN